MDAGLKFFIFIIVVSITIYFSTLARRYYKLKLFADLETKKLLYGVYSRRHLYNLTPSEFEEWCACLLRRLEYDNVIVTQSTNDGGKDIICEKNGKKYFVECKKYLYKELVEHNKMMGCKDNLNSALVGREILQKLVGAMVADNVYDGIVITTSTFNNNAIEYVNSLPSEYNIQLIDGKTLCTMYETTIFNEFGIEKQILDIENIRF